MTRRRRQAPGPRRRRRQAHDEARNQVDYLLQQSGRRADELRVVIDHARHDLLGYVWRPMWERDKRPHCRMDAACKECRRVACMAVAATAWSRGKREDAEVT